jgi:hypothetical protein
MNERLFVAVAHSKAADPLSATGDERQVGVERGCHLAAMALACSRRSKTPHLLANHAAATNAHAAAIDGTPNPPVKSEATPASTGPTIWPAPNAPVITAITRLGSPAASSLPRIKLVQRAAGVS